MYEWNEVKSRRNKAKHGISFEEVKDALMAASPLAVLPSATYPKQRLVVFRSLAGKICVVAVENREKKVRLISAHEDRKMRKIYGP